MKSFLDFEDPGADDDHPARSVTVGDLRAWHDKFTDLQTAFQFIADLTGAELQHARVGTGAEVALRQTNRKAREALVWLESVL